MKTTTKLKSLTKRLNLQYSSQTVICLKEFNQINQLMSSMKQVQEFDCSPWQNPLQWLTLKSNWNFWKSRRMTQSKMLITKPLLLFEMKRKNYVLKKTTSKKNGVRKWMKSTVLLMRTQLQQLFQVWLEFHWPGLKKLSLNDSCNLKMNCMKLSSVSTMPLLKSPKQSVNHGAA